MKRSVTSILLLTAFAVVSVTGILMAVKPFTQTTTVLHLIFGIAFITLIGFHLVNNIKSIKVYAFMKSRKWFPLSNVFIACSLIGLSLFISAYHSVYPIKALYEWTQQIKSSQASDDGKQVKSSLIIEHRNESAQGDAIIIELQRGPYYRWPTYAIWIEDTLGTYLQTIYVTQKLAKNNFHVKVIEENGETKFISEPETADERERPEALPVWAHRYGHKSIQGNIIPSGDHVIPDGYSGATFMEDFSLRTKTEKILPDIFKVRLEINQSFDWNNYYTNNRFPNDAVYSGNGKPGQPSLIYEALVDKRAKGELFKLKLVGRGHHSGQNGEIISDLNGITTAKGIIRKVLVEVPEEIDYGKDLYPFTNKK